MQQINTVSEEQKSKCSTQYKAIIFLEQFLF